MTSRFDRWLWGYRVPTEGLALFRIAHAAFALVAGVPALSWLGTLPPGWFNPPRYSLGMFFASMPSELVLSALSVVLVALYVALLFGWRTRAVSLALAAVLTVGLTFHYSLGKIDHGYVFFWAVPLVLAFSPWGEAYSVDAGRRSGAGRPGPGPLANAWPVALVALLVALGYASAGVQKLGWLDLDTATHGARRWLLTGYYVADRRDWLIGFFHDVENPYFWEGMDLAAVAFEVGALVAVLRASWFRVWVAIALTFHAANYFILNIDFTHLVGVYALFLPWGRVLPRVRVPAGLQRVLSSRRACAAAVALYAGGYAVALAAWPTWRPLWFQPLLGALDAVLPTVLPMRVALSLALGGAVFVALLWPAVDQARTRWPARAENVRGA